MRSTLVTASSGYPFFFFNDTATTEIYTLSLHDALPIFDGAAQRRIVDGCLHARREAVNDGDRKSTRLNSSHSQISYAVFCLKKKKFKRAVFIRTQALALNIHTL